MDANKNKLRRTHKDSLFRGMFSESEHFLDLYKAHSGKQLKADEIKNFVIDPKYVDRLSYKDVSFFTNDGKLIIMLELQASPNSNITDSIFIYYTEVLSLWRTIKGEDFTIGNVQCPRPEFYVSYRGKPKFNMDSLTDDDEFMAIRAKFLDISYDKLIDKDTSNSLAGYSYFYCKHDEKTAERASSEEAFAYAREECIKAGYLAGFVEKEDFIVDYKPIFSREDELRYAGELIGEEKMLRNAITVNAPMPVLQGMARKSGISLERLNELIEQEKAAGLLIGKGEEADRHIAPNKTKGEPEL